MSETPITVAGNLVADPVLHRTQSGHWLATFRIASTPRRYNAQTGAFEDGGTSYYSVAAFRNLAENAAHSLKKGQPVLVTGSLRIRPYAREDGTTGTSADIEARHLGHDLIWGRSSWAKSAADAPVSRFTEDPSSRGYDHGADPYVVTEDPHVGGSGPEAGFDGAGSSDDPGRDDTGSHSDHREQPTTDSQTVTAA